VDVDGNILVEQKIDIEAYSGFSRVDATGKTVTFESISN